MKKIRLAIMINQMTNSGPARVSSNLSTHLPDEKFEKTIMVYDTDNSSYPFVGEIIDLDTKISKNPFRRIFNNIKRIINIRKIKKEKQINVTISLLPNPNLINILTRKKDYVVISVRSFMSKELSGLHGKVYRRIFKNIYKKADVIVAVSKVVKQDLIDNFGVQESKIKVIYNFYDIEQINLSAKEEITPNINAIFESPTVITVGRLMNQKGQWHLIRAFKKVKKRIPNAKLVILGDGDLKNYLMGLAKGLGISEDIHFLGFQENPFKYISKSDVYAFPSLYEGFPNALSEAMACGIPVISSDCKSGPREILHPGFDLKKDPVSNTLFADYGLLVPVCDGVKYDATQSLTREEIILADAIVEMLNNDDLKKKYGSFAKDRMKSFDKSNIIKHWEEVISI